MEKAVGESIFIREILEELLGKKRRSIKLRVVTDSKSLVEAVSGNKPMDNKRLRVNLETIRQNLQLREVESIKWMPGKKMLADVLTKRGVNPSQMEELLQTGRRGDSPY